MEGKAYICPTKTIICQTMKKAKQLAGLCLLALLPAIPAQSQQTHRPDGWYHVREGRADSLDTAPFITLKDIAALELDTDAYGRHVITGKVREDKRERWADETAKAVGRRIAFVWRDSVLTAPHVNASIESGHFQISNRNDRELTAAYRLMMEAKGPNETDLHREDSLRQVHSRKLWDEARQYKTGITDTTFLDTRGPMSLKALDVWSGDGFNENYAFNQTVYLAALERAQRSLCVTDGRLEPTFRSAEDLHISRGLYDFIMETLAQWNRMLESGDWEIVERDGMYTVMPKKK